ncbi:hypothetical protein K490DRAFT_56024 [Saccharata proteae CBS 121410]|uniref:Uncharacterized protein n=1 Tax=Saccharata proteae CBS 121410 TaxID=1314787 RepID=A0A9P4HY58_9PEZI|nr:hypothetical protein K490DRAFT_56024 [Saccharata proteae CBS 121410]
MPNNSGGPSPRSANESPSSSRTLEGSAREQMASTPEPTTTHIAADVPGRQVHYPTRFKRAPAFVPLEESNQAKKMRYTPSTAATQRAPLASAARHRDMPSCPNGGPETLHASETLNALTATERAPSSVYRQSSTSRAAGPASKYLSSCPADDNETDSEDGFASTDTTEEPFVMIDKRRVGKETDENGGSGIAGNTVASLMRMGHSLFLKMAGTSVEK